MHPYQITDINILPGLSDHDIIMVAADIKLKFIAQQPGTKKKLSLPQTQLGRY